METVAQRALDEVSQLGVTYADVRVMRQHRENILTRDGALQGIGQEQDAGFGIRVLVNGAWGFAARGGVDVETVAPVAQAAVRAARAAARTQTRPVSLAPNPPVVDMYRSVVEVDPFAVSLEEKQTLALELERWLRGPRSVHVSQVSLSVFFTEKVLYSTEGAQIRQEVTECGGHLYALASGAGKPASRSFANYGQAGWEFVRRVLRPEDAVRVGEEAAGLVDAPYVEPGSTDLILGTEQLALMVHETCGHPTELDRVLGYEDAFAGGSFLQPSDLGRLRYGSKHVNLTADSTLPEGLGTFGYDDDGVPAQRFALVREGIFTGYLSSRDTAPVIGWQRSTGCSRADGWGRVPIVRMVNVSLEPGQIPLEELIGDVQHGLLLDTPASWSLDDKRLNFHFGTEMAREIRNGKVGELRRGATLQAITPEFWNRCDGVADQEAWKLWGLLSCAKGEPLQSLHVGHGAAPARFRNVVVGVER